MSDRPRRGRPVKGHLQMVPAPSDTIAQALEVAATSLETTAGLLRELAAARAHPVPTVPATEWVSLNEAARRLHRSTPVVKALVLDGRLPAQRDPEQADGFGRPFRIPSAALLRLVEP